MLLPGRQFLYRFTMFLFGTTKVYFSRFALADINIRQTVFMGSWHSYFE